MPLLKVNFLKNNILLFHRDRSLFFLTRTLKYKTVSLFQKLILNSMGFSAIIFVSCRINYFYKTVRSSIHQ